jgi:DNA mismatch repair protein MutH
MSIENLLVLAKQLTGKTVAELAYLLNQPLPALPSSAKGWIGQAVERYLGATSGRLDQPDFQEYGIELKTIPVSRDGIPRESTYICSITLPIKEKHWRDSRVYRKTNKILWIPYLSLPTETLGERLFGMPLLWSLDSQTEYILQQDWEELTEKLQLGDFDNLTAHQGTYLQVRPKAPHAGVQIQLLNQEGEITCTTRKGFYLRTALTKKILQAHYYI